MTAKQKVPESGVLKACLDLLACSRIWHERRNTGGMKGEYKGKTRFVKFSENGTPDIMAMVAAEYCGNAVFLDARFQRVLWIECKSDTGRQSPEQIEFQQRAEESGHYYLLVRDVDTLRDWLKAHGATR